MSDILKFDIKAVLAAIEPLREAFHEDGYDLNIKQRGHNLSAVIRARPGACEECLVPKAVIKQMLATTLSPLVPASCLDVMDIYYPGEDDPSDTI